MTTTSDAAAPIADETSISRSLDPRLNPQPLAPKILTPEP